jgi:CheY-like chemotaxis protein
MRVLLADDDRVLTHLLSTRLRQLGVEIVVAHDAMQVLMGAMRSPPDGRALRGSPEHARSDVGSLPRRGDLTSAVPSSILASRSSPHRALPRVRRNQRHHHTLPLRSVGPPGVLVIS